MNTQWTVLLPHYYSNETAEKANYAVLLHYY